MALSFSEKRALQKTVAGNLATLAEGKATFSEKRALQKQIQEAMAKLGEKAPAAPSRADWERAITDLVAAHFGTMNSDAQGIVEAQTFLLTQAWGQGLDAAATAEKIIAAATPAPATPATVEDVKKVLPLLKRFIGPSQLKVMVNATTGEEGQFFIDKLLEMAGIIEAMPQTYQTDGQGNKATVHLHYFRGGSDWYITEKDREAEQEQAFGYAILNGDREMAESGYINITELLSIGAELDLYWTPKTLGAVKGVAETRWEDKEAPTVADVGKALVAKGWRDNGDGGWLLNNTQTPETSRNGYYLVTGKDADENGAGYVEVKNEEFIPLGGSFSLTGNTVADIVDGIEFQIADYEAKLPKAPENSDLADLQAGKFDSLEPLAYLGKLKAIAEAINDIEPLKEPAIRYIEKNSERVSAVMESAFRETFGKLWGAQAGA